MEFSNGLCAYPDDKHRDAAAHILQFIDATFDQIEATKPDMIREYPVPEGNRLVRPEVGTLRHQSVKLGRAGTNGVIFMYRVTPTTAVAEAGALAHVAGVNFGHGYDENDAYQVTPNNFVYHEGRDGIPDTHRSSGILELLTNRQAHRLTDKRLSGVYPMAINLLVDPQITEPDGSRLRLVTE